MTLGIALTTLALCLNLCGTSNTEYIGNRLNIEDTQTIYELYTEIINRSKEYDKDILNYLVDGGNVPLFVPSNNQSHVGRFYIPTVSIDVAIYDSWKQGVCDKKDSACFFQYGAQRVIADHWNQGFDNIKQCKVGDAACIINGEKIERFICYAKFSGHNTDDGTLTDSEYKDIWDMNKDGITCYTCNGNWRNIVIVMFKKI